MGFIRCVRFVIILAVCIAGSTGCSPSEDDEPTDDLSSPNSRSQPVMVGEHPKGFWGKNVSLVHLNGSSVLLKLAAEKIVHRRRTTRLFVYENYDEIFLKGLRVDFPLAEGDLRQTRVKLPLRGIEDVLRSISDLPKSTADDPTGTDELDIDVLSRLLIEDVVFRILPPHKSPIDLNAKQAKMSGDFKTALFEGGMTLSGARCKIEAPTAIWSTEHDGLLLPAGYLQGHKRHKNKAFFTLTRNGSCRKVLPVPNISYVDPLEEEEAELYAAISQKMPAFARFMLGI